MPLKLHALPAVMSLAAEQAANGSTEPEIVGAVVAVRDIIRSTGNFTAAAEVILADNTLPEPGRYAKVLQAARNHLQPNLSGLAKRVESLVALAEAQMDAVDRALRPADSMEALGQQEIRTLLRTLPDGEKLALVRSDPTIARAAAVAPRQLSGLALESHAAARTVAADAVPAAASALHVARAALAMGDVLADVAKQAKRNLQDAEAYGGDALARSDRTAAAVLAPAATPAVAA